MRSLVALLLLVLATTAARAEPPERIVSVGGSVTEVLFALGLGERIIAVDSTSLYPASAQELPQVGYVRALAAEPIIALAPDLVLAEADAGPEAVLQQLSEAGVNVVLVPDSPSPEGVVAKLRAVAEAVEAEEAGAALAGEVEAGFADLAARRAALTAAPGVLFLLSHGGAPLVSGQGTSADAVIALAGGRNVVAAFEGYRPLSPEMAVLAAPEVLLLTAQGLEAMGGMEAVAADPALGLTPAVRNGRVYAYDALDLLGFGPRTPQVAAALLQDLAGP
ncbi:MAG: hemin ABC transporter substrate-binding protein [Rhodospirillales bacterium]